MNDCVTWIDAVIILLKQKKTAQNRNIEPKKNPYHHHKLDNSK